MGAHTVLLIFTFALLELSNLVDAKFCAFELNGERRYYTCPRNEYCCNFGCCVSPAFQFYQLWYYWLLVIFMFLLCSGGGWWYRYWLQSRYRTCPGSILPVTNPNSRHSRVATRAPSTQQRRRPSRTRVARVSYNSSRDAVVLHRIWKGPQNCPPPSYSSAQAEFSTDASNQSSSFHSSISHPPITTPVPSSLFPPGHMPHSSAGINGQECPYYQLYGPPPSYDSVMSELGEGSVPIVSSVRQTNAVNINTSVVSQDASPGVSTTNDIVGNNVIPSGTASSSQHNEISPEGTSDGLRITEGDVHNVHAGRSTNVQYQDSDSSYQTIRAGDIKSSTT